MLCNLPSTLSSSRTFVSPQKETLCLLKLSSHSPFPFSLVPETTSLLSVSGFAYSDVPYKWDRTVCGFNVLLLSLSTFSRFIRVVAHISTSLDDSVVLYGSTTRCSFIFYQLMDLWVVSTSWILLIRLPWIFVSNFCSNISFQFIWVYIQEWNFCIMWYFVLTLRNHQTALHR